MIQKKGKMNAGGSYRCDVCPSRGTFWCAGVGLAFGHQWLIVVGTQSKRHRGREVEGLGFLSR